MKYELIKVHFKSGKEVILIEDAGFYDAVSIKFIHGDFDSLISYLESNQKTKISFHPSSVEYIEFGG